MLNNNETHIRTRWTARPDHEQTHTHHAPNECHCIAEHAEFVPENYNVIGETVIFFVCFVFAPSSGGRCCCSRSIFVAVDEARSSNKIK